MSLQGAVLRAAWRPAAVTIDVAQRSEAELRRRATEGLGQATLAVLDGVLASSYTDVAVQRVFESDLVERALARALSGDVVADRLLADGFVERLAARFVEGPELQRIVEQTLESLAVERLVLLVVESRVVQEAIARVVDETVARLPSSEAMWTLIDEVAQSPAVADAIAQQGFGFADQVGEEVRDRSRNVDDRLERTAWRILRRRPRPPAGPAPLPTGP